jgi:hypothetical protein
MSTRDFFWGKDGGAYGWRPNTLVVSNVEIIRELNLSGTPRATSTCRGMTFTLLLFSYLIFTQIKYTINKMPLWEKSEYIHPEFTMLAVCQLLSQFKKEKKAYLWLNSWIQQMDSFRLAERDKRSDFAY